MDEAELEDFLGDEKDFKSNKFVKFWHYSENSIKSTEHLLFKWPKKVGENGASFEISLDLIPCFENYANLQKLMAHFFQIMQWYVEVKLWNGKLGRHNRLMLHVGHFHPYGSSDIFYITFRNVTHEMAGRIFAENISDYELTIRSNKTNPLSESTIELVCLFEKADCGIEIRIF